MEITCPHCCVALEAEEDQVGMTVNCPQCQGEFVITAAQDVNSNHVSVNPVPAAEPETPAEIAPSPIAAGPRGERFYRPSGKINFLRGVIALNAGILLVFMLAVVYSYALRYIPFIYLNALFTLGFAAVIGYAAIFMNVWARNRNRIFAFCGTGLIAFLGLWFAWGFWVTTLIEELKLFSITSLWVMQPRVIFFFAGEVMFVDGYMTIGRFARSAGRVSITGNWLLIFWILEALSIVGLAIWVFFKGYRSMAFCEKCENWTKTFYTSPPLEVVEDEDAFRKALVSGDFSVLVRLCKRGDCDRYTQYTLEGCLCGESVLLTVNDISVYYNSKGEASTTKRAFVKTLYITPETAQLLTGKNDLSVR